MLKIGVIATSRKRNEKRVPIHPHHLSRIPEELRSHLILERGYGERFGIEDPRIAPLIGRFAERDEIFHLADVVLLPKPMREDFLMMKEGGILWGWPHCVQRTESTQLAIDRRLTLIAFEAMYHWSLEGHREIHIFCKSNELAGYCAVFHALQVIGSDAHYGPLRKAAVLSLGSVSRGAVFALAGRGFSDITIYTQRPPYLVQNQPFGCEYRQMQRHPGNERLMMAVGPDGSLSLMADVLADADIIVNGILQDTDRPVLFLQEDDVSHLRPGCLIIDISCDAGMGFPWARPTSFDDPTFMVGEVTYYAVDHTPSYLWNSASWSLSEALLPYLPVVMGGPRSWDQEPTVRRAIEIREGVIQNPKIIVFQRRRPDYPYLRP